MRLKALLLVAAVATSCATRPCDWPEAFKKSSHCEQGICPPAPPEDGPGSANSPHASFQRLVLGQDASDPLHTVIYLPALPQPTEAPVVLFLHGYFDAEPEPYEAMLQHMARKGFIVIYPSYGQPLKPKEWADNARAALQKALQTLETETPVKPDRTRLAYVGHSIGAILALHLAAEKPQPRLVITLDAAGRNSLAWPFISIDKDSLSRLTSDTWLLMLMAEETYQYRWKDPDHCVNEEDPPTENCSSFDVTRLAFLKTKNIPSTQKAALMIPSDQEGKVQLRSEHNAVQADCGFFRKPIDAVDTWGYWKLTVGALSFVLREDKVDYAFAESEARRAFGTWSNGRKARSIVSLNSCLQQGACPQ